jgi:tetratricopeptide (TPR) repeat protein
MVRRWAAKLYETGDDDLQDLNKAASLYKKACDGGNADGCSGAKELRGKIEYARDIKRWIHVSWKNLEKANKENTKGLRAHSQGKYDKALAHYRRAWETNPNHIPARYNAACVYALMGKTTEAVTLLGKLEEMDTILARTLLLKAPQDPHLTAVHDDLEFSALTWVKTPPTVYRYENLFSDPNDEVCIFVSEEYTLMSCAPMVMTFEDCTTGKRLKTMPVLDCSDESSAGRHVLPRFVHADAAMEVNERLDAWLMMYGAVAWEEIQGEDSDTATAWFEKKLRRKMGRKRYEEAHLDWEP